MGNPNGAGSASDANTGRGDAEFTELPSTMRVSVRTNTTTAGAREVVVLKSFCAHSLCRIGTCAIPRIAIDPCLMNLFS